MYTTLTLKLNLEYTKVVRGTMWKGIDVVAAFVIGGAGSMYALQRPSHIENQYHGTRHHMWAHRLGLVINATKYVACGCVMVIDGTSTANVRADGFVCRICGYMENPQLMQPEEPVSVPPQQLIWTRAVDIRY